MQSQRPETTMISQDEWITTPRTRVDESSIYHASHTLNDLTVSLRQSIHPQLGTLRVNEGTEMHSTLLRVRRIMNRWANVWRFV
ncbi:hypothetical protein EYR38_002758 [Pleurotus pulmonarius]|nr:hypothetical protein EYR38_002758 [Pleurotus pulmonarius]